MPKISKEALMKWRESENLKNPTNPSKGEPIIQTKKKLPPPPMRRPVRGSMKPASFSILPDSQPSGQSPGAAQPPQKVYKEYRTGLLKKTYETISNNNKAFVDDCMSCPEVRELVEDCFTNQIQLDAMGGIPKLLLTIFSKHNIHSR